MTLSAKVSDSYTFKKPFIEITSIVEVNRE